MSSGSISIHLATFNTYQDPLYLILPHATLTFFIIPRRKFILIKVKGYIYVTRNLQSQGQKKNIDLSSFKSCRRLYLPLSVTRNFETFRWKKDVQQKIESYMISFNHLPSSIFIAHTEVEVPPSRNYQFGYYYFFFHSL